MLALSGTYICQPTFEPEQCVQNIDAYGVTALHEAPTIFKKLIETDAIETADVGSVRVATYSGAPMDSTLLDNVIETFDPHMVSNQYGCTEAYGPLGQLNLRKEGEPTETGVANIFHRTRIVELGSADPGATVDPGTEGELVIALDSPTVFSGYLNKPAANENAIHDGWFFTGDVAYETDDSHTIITGRSDDMIISGGENIYPAEVEDTLASHPEVVDVGVVGAADETWGEIPKAYVEADGSVTVSELDQLCQDSSSLANYKRPREYEVVAEVPRNPSGKIMRYKLRDRE
jgi:2-furoate---CoA ligase